MARSIEALQRREERANAAFPTVGVRVPAIVSQQLSQMARASGCSVAAVVRHALAQSYGLLTEAASGPLLPNTQISAIPTPRAPEILAVPVRFRPAEPTQAQVAERRVPYTAAILRESQSAPREMMRDTSEMMRQTSPSKPLTASLAPKSPAKGSRWFIER
jgi:hypothetical protein